MIKTIAQARKFVGKVKVCTIFPSDKVDYTSLWENVDLPDKQPGEKGWGKKMQAVWSWKTRLPAEYPNDIYYGKIQGGLAVLMDMDRMANTHFPQAYQSVRELSEIAQGVCARITRQPSATGELREEAVKKLGCTKSQFNTALVRLQITMNIVRLNDPDAELDTWVPFKELYPDVWRRHVTDD